jgi:hypothetical protein
MRPHERNVKMLVIITAARGDSFAHQAVGAGP